MCDGHDHDDTEATIGLMQAHQDRIAPYWRAAFRMPAARDYKPGTLVWLADHYNTGRVVGPYVSELTGATSLVEFVVVSKHADGTTMRVTYGVERLRPATVEHVFVWPVVAKPSADGTVEIDRLPALGGDIVVPQGWDKIEA